MKHIVLCLLLLLILLPACANASIKDGFDTVTDWREVEWGIREENGEVTQRRMCFGWKYEGEQRERVVQFLLSGFEGEASLDILMIHDTELVQSLYPAAADYEWLNLTFDAHGESTVISVFGQREEDETVAQGLNIQASVPYKLGFTEQSPWEVVSAEIARILEEKGERITVSGVSVVYVRPVSELEGELRVLRTATYLRQIPSEETQLPGNIYERGQLLSLGEQGVRLATCSLPMGEKVEFLFEKDGWAFVRTLRSDLMLTEGYVKVEELAPN